MMLPRTCNLLLTILLVLCVRNCICSVCDNFVCEGQHMDLSLHLSCTQETINLSITSSLSSVVDTKEKYVYYQVGYNCSSDIIAEKLSVENPFSYPVDAETRKIGDVSNSTIEEPVVCVFTGCALVKKELCWSPFQATNCTITGQGLETSSTSASSVVSHSVTLKSLIGSSTVSIASKADTVGIISTTNTQQMSSSPAAGVVGGFYWFIIGGTVFLLFFIGGICTCLLFLATTLKRREKTSVFPLQHSSINSPLKTDLDHELNSVNMFAIKGTYEARDKLDIYGSILTIIEPLQIPPVDECSKPLQIQFHTGITNTSLDDKFSSQNDDNDDYCTDRTETQSLHESLSGGLNNKPVISSEIRSQQPLPAENDNYVRPPPSNSSEQYIGTTTVVTRSDNLMDSFESTAVYDDDSYVGSQFSEKTFSIAVTAATPNDYIKGTQQYLSTDCDQSYVQSRKDTVIGKKASMRNYSMTDSDGVSYMAFPQTSSESDYTHSELDITDDVLEGDSVSVSLCDFQAEDKIFTDITDSSYLHIQHSTTSSTDYLGNTLQQQDCAKNDTDSEIDDDISIDFSDFPTETVVY